MNTNIPCPLGLPFDFNFCKMDCEIEICDFTSNVKLSARIIIYECRTINCQNTPK